MKSGWTLRTSAIESVSTTCDSDYVVFNIDIGGFRGKEQFIGEQASDIADITFVFETSCSSNCVFHFIEVSPSRWHADELRSTCN